MRRPTLGSIAVALLGGAAVFVACAFFGVETPFALAWGLAVSIVIAAARVVQTDELPVWPPQVPADDRIGVSDVARLAWVISPTSGHPGRSAVLRVTEVLRRRLRARGLAFDDPDDAAAIDRLLGPDVRAGLLAPRPTVSALEAAVAAAERHSPETQEIT